MSAARFKPRPGGRFAGLTALVLLAAAAAWWTVKRAAPVAPPAPATLREVVVPSLRSDELAASTPDFWSPAWGEAAADATWLARLRQAFTSKAGLDEAIRGFTTSGLRRGQKIGTLLALLGGLAPADRPLVLDVLAAFRPIEASAGLASMLHETRDAQDAVKLLQTLRAATLITAADGRVDFDDPELATAFELIQKTFAAELARTDGDADRFRAAAAAIPDVFPGDEAVARFESLAAALEAARAAGRAFHLTESELYGRWLEFAVGAVDDRDFREVADFIRRHPAALADEATKARVLDQLRITPLRPDEDAAPLIDQLEPHDAPDDSFVRWLEVKSRLGGKGDSDFPGLLRSASPLRKAALIHYGELDLRQLLDRSSADSLRRELTAAAARLPVSEERDFIESAAAAIPGQ